MLVVMLVGGGLGCLLIINVVIKMAIGCCCWVVVEFI